MTGGDASRRNSRLNHVMLHVAGNVCCCKDNFVSRNYCVYNQSINQSIYSVYVTNNTTKKHNMGTYTGVTYTKIQTKLSVVAIQFSTSDIINLYKHNIRCCKDAGPS